MTLQRLNFTHVLLTDITEKDKQNLSNTYFLPKEMPLDKPYVLVNYTVYTAEQYEDILKQNHTAIERALNAPKSGETQ